jgi:gliding motility-associated-like protein
VTDSVRVAITKTKDCPLIPEFLYDTTQLSLYSQNDSSAVFTIRTAGSIKIKARMINRCDTLADSISVKIYNNPTVVNLGADTVLCTGSSLILRAGKNFKSYKWQDNSTDSNFTVNRAGLYYVAVTDSCNKSYRDTINILEDSPLPFNIGADTSKCNDDSIRIIAPAGFTQYTWGPDYNISTTIGRSITAFPAVDTKYFAVAEKTNGCFVNDSIFVAVKRSKPVYLTNDTSICKQDSIILNAGAGFEKYSWSTGETGSSITVRTVGMYTLAATDANGCVSKDTFTLKKVYPLPVVSLGNDTAICRGTNYTLRPGGFATFLWQDNSKNNSYTVSKPGTYWLHATDNNTCKSGDTITITGYKELPVNFLPDTVSICEGELMALKPNLSFKNYRWSDQSSANTMQITSKGVYWLIATNDEGCVNADTTIVSYKDCYKALYFPSAFTPNEDGRNDLFRAVNYGVLDNFHLVIVNRFGQKVFETVDVYKGWDGKVNGVPQDTGTFVWYCNYHFQGGPKSGETQKGTLVLIR